MMIERGVVSMTYGNAHKVALMLWWVAGRRVGVIAVRVDNLDVHNVLVAQVRAGYQQ